MTYTNVFSRWCSAQSVPPYSAYAPTELELIVTYAWPGRSTQDCQQLPRPRGCGYSFCGLQGWCGFDLPARFCVLRVGCSTIHSFDLPNFATSHGLVQGATTKELPQKWRMPCRCTDWPRSAGSPRCPCPRRGGSAGWATHPPDTVLSLRGASTAREAGADGWRLGQGSNLRPAA